MVARLYFDEIMSIKIFFNDEGTPVERSSKYLYKDKFIK